MRGVELGAQGKVTERWSVYGGLVAMETEVTTPAFLGRELANIPKTQFKPLEQVPTDRGLVGRWSGDLRHRGL